MKKNGTLKCREIPIDADCLLLIGFYYNVNHPEINATLDAFKTNTIGVALQRHRRICKLSFRIHFSRIH